MNFHHKHMKYRWKYLNLMKNQRGGLNKPTIKSTVKSTFKSTDKLIEDPTITGVMSDSNNEFAIKVFDTFDSVSNIFSPLCLSFIMALLLLAISDINNNDLSKLLGYNYNLTEIEYIYDLLNNASEMINIFVTNRVALNEEYVNMIDNVTHFINKSFEKEKSIVNKINNYLNRKTNTVVKDVINTNNIDIIDKFFIVNTININPIWENPFNINNTIKVKFHETNLIDMMHQINYFDYYGDKLIQMVELPFNKKNYVMGVILPRRYLERNDLNYSVNNVPKFTSQEINEYINNKEFKKIDLYLPKFVHKRNTNFSPIFRKLGITNIFHSNQSELDTISNEIYVSGIYHEAVVTVDESSGNINIIDDEESAIIFRADHTFIYYIRHVPTNLLLFYGDYQGDNSNSII